MSIIFVLIPIAVLFVLIGLGVFFWAVRSRQFDDLDKEAYSILFDNQQAANKPTPVQSTADDLPTTVDSALIPQADPASGSTAATKEQ
jgi:cbb3-type cytochrome oxidase maturation protein